MHSISSKEISFVSYGNTSKGASTIYNPFKVNGEEILELIHRKQYNEWITSMKWGIVSCYARMFPICVGRNKRHTSADGINWQEIRTEIDNEDESHD
ncbi:hypothetical protein OUZ56_010107 [Daphnia magna]|uniref:Uncharacterized protein n=1 Tax=Daphnia magna TaxID=35525 RepID=A0ABR0AI08_9CRUS|nr:hypothetical protein OUZ56_010107 [Daphnia magna]